MVMNLWKQIFIFSLTVALASSSPAYAQSERLKELLSLDIEELVQITVASKKSESIYDAPGIISIVTKEDIRRYGGNNLRDLLHRLPNMYVFGSSFTPNTALSIRGQTLTAADSHVLYLINGRPVRDSHVGGMNTPIYLAVPIDGIERLEIIRGPSSILYGTNAFSGAINIVTKTGRSNSEDLSLGYGSFNTRISKASIERVGEDYSVYAHGRIFESHGWNFNLTSPSGITDSTDYGHDAYGGIINASYKNFTLNGLFALANNKVIGLNHEWPTERHRLSKSMVDLGYVYDLSEDWDVNLNVTYNRHENKGQPSDHSRYSDYLLEASVQGNATDDLYLLFGSVYEWHFGSIKTHGNKVNKQWHTTYAQAQYQVTDWLKLVAGMQMNNPESVPRNFSPRAGAVINFTSNWGAKLLYGEAFRSPYGAETSLNIPGVIVGNPQFRPEEIATWEAQLFYHDNGASLSATYYESVQDNGLGFGPNKDGVETFINRPGEVEYSGIELEGKYSFSNEWNLEGNLSYQKGIDKGTDDKDVGNIPHFMTKWGLTYAPEDKGYLVGVHASYFGEAGKTEREDPTIQVVNPTPDKYTYVSANIEFDLNSYLKISNMPETTFSIYGENLMDEEVYFPEFNNKKINSFPLRGGRAVYATLKVKF